MKNLKLSAIFLIFAIFASLCLAEIKIENSAKDGIAKIGEKVAFKISGERERAFYLNLR